MDVTAQETLYYLKLIVTFNTILLAYVVSKLAFVDVIIHKKVRLSKHEMKDIVRSMGNDELMSIFQDVQGKLDRAEGKVNIRSTDEDRRVNIEHDSHQ